MRRWGQKGPAVVRLNGGRAQYLMTKAVLSEPPEIHRKWGRVGVLTTVIIRNPKVYINSVVRRVCIEWGLGSAKVPSPERLEGGCNAWT